MKKGWTEPSKGERSIRDREYGLAGQDIWLRLIKLGFVQDDQKWNAGKPIKVTLREQCMKNWLIWGYWEKNR